MRSRSSRICAERSGGPKGRRREADQVRGRPFSDRRQQGASPGPMTAPARACEPPLAAASGRRSGMPFQTADDSYRVAYDSGEDGAAWSGCAQRSAIRSRSTGGSVLRSRGGSILASVEEDAVAVTVTDRTAVRLHARTIPSSAGPVTTLASLGSAIPRRSATANDPPRSPRVDRRLYNLAVAIRRQVFGQRLSSCVGAFLHHLEACFARVVDNAPSRSCETRLDACYCRQVGGRHDGAAGRRERDLGSG